MHKKLLMFLGIPILLLTMTACGTTQEESDMKLTKTIELTDSLLGYTTTLEYDAEEKYSELIETKQKDTNIMTFENEDIAAEFETHYTTMNLTDYDALEKNNSQAKYYKQYTFGDYTAYAYGTEEDTLELSILLGADDTKVEVLLVTITNSSPSSRRKASAILEEKEIQELWNSMEFVKE